MLNDVQSGERSGLFAICNYSVSLATDPWSQQGGRVRPWDLGSVIIDCGDKHYNTVVGKGIPEC